MPESTQTNLQKNYVYDAGSLSWIAMTQPAGGTGGTAATDDAAFTIAVSDGTPIMGVVTTDQVDSGDVGVVKMTTFRTLGVTLYDSSGNEQAAGGGTQYTEDAAAAANPIGNALILRRKDTLSAVEVSADGDNIAANATAKGELVTRDADAVALLTTVDADTSNISTKVDTLAGAVAGAEMQVDVVTSALPTGASTLAEQQSQTTHLATIAGAVKAEDAAHSTGHTGIPGLSVRQDTAAALAGTDADYQPLITDASGRLHVNVGTSALPSGAATSAKQDTIIGHVDGIEALLTTIDADTSALFGTVAGTEVQVDVVAALPAGDNALGRVKITDGTTVADVIDLTTRNPLAVAIVDGAGDQITSFGGGTQYTEDAAAAANPVGTVPILVRTDTPASAVSADGDNVAQRGTTYGAAYVTLLDTGGTAVSVGGGTQYTEDAAAAANPVGTALMLVREDARAGTLVSADGDNVAARGNNKGELYVKTTDADALLTTIDADTSNLSTKIDTLAGAVAGSEMQVDVVTSALPSGASTLAEQQSQTTHLATLAGAVRAEDAAHSTGHTGIPALSVRQDTAAALAGTDADYQPLITDSTGRLHVNVGNTVTVGSHAVTNAGTFAVQVDGAALTALQLIDDPVATLGTTTYTEAATKGMIIGAVRRDADTTLVDTTNEVGPLQMDANGRLKVEAFSGETLPVSLTSTTVTGTVAVTQSGTWDEVGINDSGNSITVDNGGTFAVQVDGAALTALQLIDNPVLVDDAAFTPATSSVMMAGFEYDDTTPDSVNEGDAGAARMSANRNIYVQLRDNAGNERGLNIDASGNANVVLAAGTNTNEVVGDAAHDAPIAGNPVRIGGRALTADYTAVAAGDTADFITTLTGKQVVMPFANPANTWAYAAASGGITNTTGVTAKAAGGAGVRLYVTDVQVINGHATVSTDVQIRDGAAGTVLWRGFAQAAGGGASVKFNTPLRGTANTLLEVACGTTGSATYFNLQGFSAAE